jgi:hypothetical protein
MNPSNRRWPRRDVLRFGLANVTAFNLRATLTGAAGQPAVTDVIPVQNPKTSQVHQVPCERIAVGEPDDYKPCVALLPSGELLMSAFHPDIKVGKKFIEQNLLFRSKDGGKTWSGPEKLDLLGREPYLTVLKDGTVFMTGHQLANDARNPFTYTHG